MSDEKTNSKIDTQEHKGRVQTLLLAFSVRLIERSRKHDDSKLEEPELSLFAEWGPKLKELKYGSKEYGDALRQMGKALQHHYEHNSHHPEHHKNGINGMDLFDLVEMVCDWKAASMRMNSGDFLTSLDHNVGRFDIDPQLADIIANTAVFLDKTL